MVIWVDKDAVRANTNQRALVLATAGGFIWERI